MEVTASDHATIKLMYTPGPDSAEKRSKIQYLRPGVNHVMFSLNKNELSDNPEFLFVSKSSLLEVLSLSIYTF